MKKVIMCLFILFTVMLAQAEFKFTVVKKLSKGEAEIEIEGKTFDEVWKGVIRTFMSRKFQVKESDKESGIILAKKRPSLFYEEGDLLTTWQFLIEEDEGKILLYLKVDLGSDAISAKRPFKKFCEKLKEVLEKRKEINEVTL